MRRRGSSSASQTVALPSPASTLIGTYLGRGAYEEVMRIPRPTRPRGPYRDTGLYTARRHALPHPLGARPIALSGSNTRESGHLAYEATPFGVCAPDRLGTTI